MLSYEIIVHCICGQVKKYMLDLPKYPIAIVGREDKSIPYQHIGLCADDDKYLSRTALYFAYDVDKKDWVLGNGFPIEKYWNYDKKINKLDINEKNKLILKATKQKHRLYVIRKENLELKMSEEISNKLKNIKESHENPYLNFFEEVDGYNIIELNKISGIGIFPVNYIEEEKIFYNKQKHLGIKHLLLPNIPFHWYIEVNNNMTNRDVIINSIKKTRYLSKVYENEI